MSFGSPLKRFNGDTLIGDHSVNEWKGLNVDPSSYVACLPSAAEDKAERLIEIKQTTPPLFNKTNSLQRRY